MALQITLTDGRYGDVLDSDGVDCSIDDSVHEVIFVKLNEVSGGFPHLQRFSDFYKDAFVGRESLELLIQEIERASSHFDSGSPEKAVFESFHSLCCIARAKGRGVSGYCD